MEEIPLQSTPFTYKYHAFLTISMQDMSKMDAFFNVIEGYQLEDANLLEVRYRTLF